LHIYLTVEQLYLAIVFFFSFSKGKLKEKNYVFKLTFTSFVFLIDKKYQVSHQFKP